MATVFTIPGNEIREMDFQKVMGSEFRKSVLLQLNFKEMNRKLTSIVVLIVLIFAAACKKDDKDPIPEPQENYSVNYKLTMGGSYENLVLKYFEPGTALQQATSISSPWEKAYDNFQKGDSVAFRLSFKTLPSEAVSYQYSVTVSQGGSFISGNSGSQSLTPGDTTFTIRANWADKIGD